MSKIPEKEMERLAKEWQEKALKRAVTQAVHMKEWREAIKEENRIEREKQQKEKGE